MAKVHEIKPEKVAVVADIVEKLKNAQSVTIVSYSGLTVEQVTELRKQCRAEEVSYVVLKNRLVLRALQEQGIWGGKAYGNDPVKKHWRSGCLSDPKWKPAAVRSFQRYAGLCRENPPVGYTGDTPRAPQRRTHPPRFPQSPEPRE